MALAAPETIAPRPVLGGSVAVVADSACDLPEEWAAGISVVPLTVAFGPRQLRDRLDLSPEDFWRRVAEEGGPPTTASPGPEELRRAYEEAAAGGASGVVSVHLSGALSRTVESARAAAGGAPVPVEVVDTRSVSLGEGLVALAAAAAAAGGADLPSVAAATRAAAARLEVYAILDTLEFAARGGRLGRLRATLTDLLRIRPVLAMADGAPALVTRARTRARAIEELLALAAGPAEAAGVMHSGSPEVPRVVAAVAASSRVEPLVALVGAATGAHLGPRMLGVAVIRPAARRAREAA